MGLTFRIAGQASKRGIIARLPAPGRLLDDARAWVVAEYGEAVRTARSEVAPDGAVELRLELHPASDTVSITADEVGRVAATAETSAAGPGYHTFVARILERLGDELEIAWEPAGHAPAPPAASGQRAGRSARSPLADRAGVEATHRVLLSRTLGQALDLRRKGVAGIQVGTRPGTRFTFDGAIATPLGPRSDTWLEQAVRDPRLAVDIRPWWTDAMDARYMLQRASCLLWTDVRWRAPADDAERAVIDEALRLLRRALPADPSLPYPWREWQELIELRRIDDPVADRVAPRAARDDASRPPVGYRRFPVTIVHEGWALEVPGSFAERRTPEEWWGGEKGRGVTLAGTATGGTTSPMGPQAFLDQVAGHLGADVLSHRDGGVMGRARLGTDEGSGVETAVLDGYMAVTGRGAAIRIEFDDPDDWQWAVELWRSLRPA